MKKLFLLLLFLSSHLLANTSDVISSIYPSYYDAGAENYELYYCHKNAAAVLNELKLNGADLEEITVIILQDVEGREEIAPDFTRFDGEFKWHVFFMHDGMIYDQNIQYGRDGIILEDYFSLMLGPNIDLNDVVIRTVPANEFQEFFYNSNGDYKGYAPHKFIETFLLGSTYPQERAQYLKWY